jgi:hypothetical protein
MKRKQDVGKREVAFGQEAGFEHESLASAAVCRGCPPSARPTRRLPAWVTVEHQIERGRSGPEAGRSAVRTVRASGPDGPRVRRTD